LARVPSFYFSMCLCKFTEKEKALLGQQGWREQYYEVKFHWAGGSTSAKTGKSNLCYKYLEGLLWVMKYYYNGCASWEWFFPFHYAPFASDLSDFRFNAAGVRFTKGSPFKPFEQLMSVLPAVSAKGVLPDVFVELMTNPKSPIFHYYPEDFEVDLNGKR